MPSDFSSDCESLNCLDDMQIESDGNSHPNKSVNNSLHSRSRKKSRPSCSVQFFPAPCSTKSENNTKEDSVFLPSEGESYEESTQNNHLSMSPECIAKKLRPLRELTVQELLKEFGDTWKFQPNSISVGYFKEQVVMKFRRALYYSGIWVAHVQGYRLVKHFSANYFKRNPGCLQRLVPWLKRELTAVYGDYGYTVKNLLATILHHMTEYDLDSESFIHLLEPYLQQYTHHFLHEFISFVHSPYNMDTYDKQAIYQCPSASSWVKKKSTVTVPVLPLPSDQAVLVSKHDTKQSKNTKGQWNNDERPLSGLQQFSNVDSFLKKSEIPVILHKAASKKQAWIKDKSDSGMVSTNNMFLHCAKPKERGQGSLSLKKSLQERTKEGINLIPSHVQNLGKSETTARAISAPAIFNQEQPAKFSLKERKILRVDQQTNCRKKEAEKNNYLDSSPKIFQKRHPRQRSLIRCKCRKRDPSWSSISEIALSPKTDGRKLTSSRKKRMICRQSSQFAVGSHSSRTTQRHLGSHTQRSKSWCDKLSKRSVSRDSSTHSLKGRHRSECFIHKLFCEHSKEKNVYGHESIYPEPSSTTVQYGKLSSTVEKRPKCCSKSEVASQAGSHCINSTCLHTKKPRSPSKEEMKQRDTFPRARKTRGVRHRKNKCQYPDLQATKEVCDEVNDIQHVSSLSECAFSCRRQIPKKKVNSSLQKHCLAKNERKGDKLLETESYKLF
ncbi:PREDICTED: E3 ubiquitin-protein ligase Topors-like [Condylura cristata]|uniref:E3 ubiquitin-protein ligase Topors-like n=1 Tax=Condylura cristata TaxID=143302 RepID=UPI0006436A6D|nr:PREDICTED: E3 ubiquitin-protein ligase Topors-like [Condylura cristata]